MRCKCIINDLDYYAQNLFFDTVNGAVIEQLSSVKYIEGKWQMRNFFAKLKASLKLHYYISILLSCS